MKTVTVKAIPHEYSCGCISLYEVEVVVMIEGAEVKNQVLMTNRKCHAARKAQEEGGWTAVWQHLRAQEPG